MVLRVKEGFSFDVSNMLVEGEGLVENDDEIFNVRGDGSCIHKL